MTRVPRERARHGGVRRAAVPLRLSAVSMRLTAGAALLLALAAGPAAGQPIADPSSHFNTARGSEAGPAAGAAGQTQTHRIVVQGIAVDFEVTPLGGGELREGGSARFRFRIADTATGQPLAGLYPAAWVDEVAAAPWIESEPRDCRQKVESFAGGGLLARAQLDLNGYYVLALNDDATITVVDPLFGLGDSKLLALIPLASRGEDWALAAPLEKLFVALPASQRVAVVDTANFQPAGSLEAGLRPRRVALQPDGGYLWVLGEAFRGGPAGGAAAEIFDPRTLARVGRIALGSGPHDIAFSDDSRYAFVTNRDAGTLSVLDVRRLAKAGEVATGREPVSVAFSSQAQLAYVSHAAAGSVVAVDGARRRVVARIQAEPGLGQIAFAPGGRYAFVLNTRADKVHILDAASNRIAQTAHVEHGPDQVDFSNELAYVRHRDSETVLTIPLKAIGSAGTPVSVMDFPGGQKPFGRGAPLTAAAAIVKAPGANAVLVANPADRMIYFYQEGMAAPMGGFSNYERQPRAVLVVDRSLREASPGAYEAIARLDRPGRFEAAFLLDAPRLVQCFEFTVAADPARERERQAALPPRVEYLAAAATVPVGKRFTVRFKLSDPTTGAPLRGLDDVSVLCFRPPGNHQFHEHARQVEAGIYEAELEFDEPGAYTLYVASPSRQLLFRRSRPLAFEAVAASPVPSPRRW